MTPTRAAPARCTRRCGKLGSTTLIRRRPRHPCRLCVSICGLLLFLFVRSSTAYGCLVANPFMSKPVRSMMSWRRREQRRAAYRVAAPSPGPARYQLQQWPLEVRRVNDELMADNYDDDDYDDESTSYAAEVVNDDAGEDDDDWTPDAVKARRQREAAQYYYGNGARSGVQNDDDENKQDSRMSYKSSSAAATTTAAPSAYTDEEEDIIDRMGGKSTNASGNNRRREPGYLGDSTLAEIATDYVVPVCYLADVLCSWGVPVPVSVHDRLGDLVTGEQAFAILEAVHSLDVAALHDRYSNSSLLQLCDEWDLNLQTCFEHAMTARWSLPFGVQTHLRVEQEEELMRLYCPLPFRRGPGDNDDDE